MLRMGFGRVDTSPALGLRMAGTPPWPPAAGVNGPLRGPGVLADELEARHGGAFGILQGASADTANLDPAAPDPDAWFGWEHAVAMGRALADRADEALAAGRPGPAA